jgi:hypothetical protein
MIISGSGFAFASITWALLFSRLMASQKLTNCCVAAIALVTAAYLSTPHSSTLRALHLALFA